MTSPTMRAIEEAVKRMGPFPSFEPSGAPAAPRPDYHPVRDMPRCKWAAPCRWNFDVCMDCGKPRYPVAESMAAE